MRVDVTHLAPCCSVTCVRCATVGDSRRAAGAGLKATRAGSVISKSHKVRTSNLAIGALRYDFWCEISLERIPRYRGYRFEGKVSMLGYTCNIHIQVRCTQPTSGIHKDTQKQAERRVNASLTTCRLQEFHMAICRAVKPNVVHWLGGRDFGDKFDRRICRCKCLRVLHNAGHKGSVSFTPTRTHSHAHAHTHMSALTCTHSRRLTHAHARTQTCSPLSHAPHFEDVHV